MEEISQKDVRRILQQSYAAKKTKAKLTNSALKPYFICMIGKKIVVELNENSSAIGNLQHFDNDMNLICKDASFITKNGSITKVDMLYLRGSKVRYIYPADDDCVLQTRNRGAAKKSKFHNFKVSRKQRLDEKMQKRIAAIKQYYSEKRKQAGHQVQQS
ncbi:hypothetical protein T10_8621 [Trichinella papuae]|uniref:Sm domain-containing protein n=2 Tax=Trichinella TaxID=6333 RepID=A0A0V1N7G7_9BILA|nr:hypothetical protein T10_8621 [Trichinella papuae]